MATNSRPVPFLDHLPQLFRADAVEGSDLLRPFLQPFEILFEELEAEIEGTADRRSGGIPDLFSPDTTPPAELTHRPQPEFDYLSYLASWIGLPLRADKDVAFNRRFFNAAIPLYSRRSTLPGMEALLRAWLKGDLQEFSSTDPALPLMTDLTRAHTDVDAVFQLDVTATLGINTVLGEGPPFFFIVDLETDPLVRELRTPAGLDLFERAAQFLLDTEKPAHTYYQLRLRAHPMELAPQGATTIDGRPAAQVGETTLLVDAPRVINSDS